MDAIICNRCLCIQRAQTLPLLICMPQIVWPSLRSISILCLNVFCKQLPPCTAHDEYVFLYVLFYTFGFAEVNLILDLRPTTLQWEPGTLMLHLTHYLFVDLGVKGMIACVVEISMPAHVLVGILFPHGLAMNQRLRRLVAHGLRTLFNWLW